MAKATFTVGVFGAAARRDRKGTIRVLVNVRTDQEKQRQLAGLPLDSPVKIVDLPGGGIEIEDLVRPESKNVTHDVLCREIKEETGCVVTDFTANGLFGGPYLAISQAPESQQLHGDLALWIPVRLSGPLFPSAEAQEHVWISHRELITEKKYRAPGRLGKDGRMGRMILAAIEWFKQQTDKPELFS